MDEFDEQEELYNPASPQYQNRAERQRGIMNRIVAEGHENARRRRDYVERWSYNFDLATYDAISDAVKHAENPEAEMHELIAATSIARLFNVPVDEARANSEYYRNLLYPNVERYEFPKAWNEGARDSFKLGTNGVALDYYGFQLMAAEMGGQPVDGILEKMNAIEAENEKLAANMPTGWGNRLLQFGAQMAPYTGLLIGVGALAAFAAPALGIGGAAAIIGTAASSITAAGLGSGSVYATLRKDGVDKDIAAAVSVVGGLGIGAVNGVIGTVAGNLGNTPQAAIEKAAAAAAKNLTLKLGASPYGKALAARTAGVLTDYALEGFGEALEEGAENAIAEVSHFVAAALHNSRERDAEAKFEEVFDRVTGQWESYFREAMADEKIPYHTAEEIIASTKESVIGGFKGGLLFGVFGAFRNGAAPLAEYKAVKAAARVSESAEEFQERTAGAAVFESMDEKERTEAQNAIYENERRPLAEMEKGKQAELAETRYFGEDAETAEYGEAAQDEETGGAALPEAAREKGPEYRENGELKTRDTTSEEDGATHGRYAAVSEDGRVYGEIRYTERDGAVEVEGVRMAEGRENLRPELWAEFNRYYEGAPIAWNPRTDAAKKIKSEMAVKPPEEIRFENTMVNQYHVSREDAPLLTAFMKTAAAAKGRSFRQYSETIGHARSSVAELNAMDENLKPGQYHPAAVVENSTGKIRKYILTTERSNAASLIHEVAHDVFDELDGEAKNAVYNALGIDGAATTEQKERFAEAVEQYFAEGRTPHKELKSLFEKIKGLLKAIYDAAAKAGRLTPEMRDALDRVFSKAEISEEAEADGAPAPGETGPESAVDGHRTTQTEKTDTGTSGTGKTRQNADTVTEPATGTQTEAETEEAGETENAKTIDDASAAEPERVKAVFDEASDTLYMTGYHGGGSTETHGRFSTDRIGDGEGGAKYGWGLYFGSRKATATAYRKALSLIQKTGDGHEYAVELPENEDLADWDKPLSEQPQKIKDKITGLYRYEKEGGKFTVYLGDRELNTYDEENGAKTFVEAHGREGQAFGSFYKQLANALGTAKQASLFLKSLDIPGHAYLGEFATAGENQDVPNFVIYDDSALGEPELLFQTEDGLVEDAVNSRDAEDFKRIFRTKYGDEDVADIPGARNATDEWLERFYEAAMRKGKADDAADVTQRTVTREEANEEIVKNLTRDEGLLSFLQTIGNYLDSRKKNGYEPDMEEGLKYLRHGYWTSGARRVTSKKGSRELKPKVAQTLKTMIKNYPDDIRLAYGHMFGITEYREATGQTPRDKLLERARKLGDGHFTDRIATATHTELKLLGQEIGSAEIAALVEDGTVPENDPRLRDYTAVRKREAKESKERTDKIEKNISDFTARTKRLYEKDVKEYENAIKLQEQIIKAEDRLRPSGYNFFDTAKSGQAEQTRLARERAKTRREYKDLLETYNMALAANRVFAKDADLLMSLRRKKTGAEHGLEQAEREVNALESRGAAWNAIVKNTMRSVNWNTVKVDRGEELIAFQRLLYAALRKDVAAFAGPNKNSLFDAWMKYRTDAGYRHEVEEQIRNQLGRKSFTSEEHYSQAVADTTKTLAELLSKDWESYTRADFNSLYSLLPDEVALKELQLWEAEQERAEKIQIDIAYFTGEDGAPVAEISPELEDRLRQFVPGTVLSRLKHKPIAEWTFNELLEAAIAADKIYHRGIEERQLDLAVRREMTKAVQNELLETIKTVAGKTGQEARDILNKYARGATGNEARKNIFGFAWNHVSGRRFFRMMDNYSDGRFTELMHWMEDDAFNSEQRSMRGRVDPIEALMKEQKIDPRKLTDYVIERPSYAGDTSKEQFSIENLLFMKAASLDEKSLDAVVYGNFLTNDEKITMEGLQPMDKQPFMARAYERFNSVRKEADIFLAKEENQKYLELLKAVQQDYDRNFYKLDALSRRLYNRPVWKVEHYVPLMRQGFGTAQTAAQIKQLLGSAGLDTHIEKGMLTTRITIGAEHQTPVDMRLYNGWLKSVEKTEHLLAYGEAIQRWNDVFKGTGSNPLNTAVNNRYGKEAVDYIREYIGYTANPKAQRDSDKLGTVTKLLRGKTAMAYLPLKISGLLFQAASSPFPYFTELGPGRYLAAAVEMMADRSMYDRIREMSPYMRSRKFSPVQDLLARMREKSKGKIDKTADRLAELGMDALAAVDTAAVFPGWLVKYNEVLAAHKIEGKDIDAVPQEIQAEAVRQADDLVRRLQPSVRDLPPVFRSGNTLVKAILQFQSPQAVIMQQIAIDAFMPGAPPELKRANLKHAARIVASFVICGTLTNLMRQGLPDDDEEGKAALGYIAYGLSGLTDNIPIIGGGVSDSVTGALTGKWSGTVGRVSPFPMADAAFRTARNTARAFETEDYLKALKSGLDIAMLYFGLPYSAMNEAIALFKDGELHTEALLGQR